MRRYPAIDLRAKSVWVLICMAFFSLRGSNAAIQFDVFVGYDSVIREAAWFPITCEVFNDGPSFNATIEISSGLRNEEHLTHVPVELPTNTRKRIVIPMFASGGRFNMQWNGKLLDQNGRLIPTFERPIQTKIVAWDGTVLGSLARNFGGTPILPKPEHNREELKPQVARLMVDQFPDNPIALEGLNVLYLNSEKAPDLKVNQVAALIGWVRGGGHLIVAAEQIGDVNGTPWLKQFLPMDLSEMKNLKLDQAVIAWVRSNQTLPADNVETTQPSRRRGRTRSQPGNAFADLGTDSTFRDTDIPVASGQTKDGYVLFQSENTPLAVQAPRGRGKVTLLTFSPEREPFRSWKGRDYFWAKLSGIPPEIFSSAENRRYGGWSVDGVFGALIDSRQIKKLPVTWLLLLLVVYLIVIGPFDQWWLKKIGKQMLTWITFPAYVVLFSLLIYFIGYKLRAGETEWNELHIVDVLPRGDKVDLRGRTYISIYSSANARYPLSGQQGHASLRAEYMGIHAGNRQGTKARIIHQGNTFKAEVDGLVWTSSLYANEWMKTNDVPFLAAVTDTGSEYVVEIQNLMSRPLSEVRIVAGQLIFQVDPVQPNEKKTLHLSPDKGVRLRDFVRENGGYFQRAIDQRRNPLGDTSGGHLENRPLTAMTASFISLLDEYTQGGQSFVTPPGIDLAPQVERGDTVIFAWVPGFSFVEKINQFDPPRFRSDTLLRLSIPVRQKNSI
jgi:hypothetical protein